MKRLITGLHDADRCRVGQVPDGSFSSQCNEPSFSGRYRSLITRSLCRFLSQCVSQGRESSRIYCTRKALWKLNWFLRDFGYDSELLGRDEVDERQLVGLRGVVKISPIVITALLCSDSTTSPPPVVGKNFPREPGRPAGGVMTYSYTQISQYLTCPRRYRHRYLDGWKEKERGRRCSSAVPSNRPGRLLSP